jgi:hypothetical protein
MLIYNKTRQIPLVQNATVAKTFFDRAKGLLGKKHILKDEALIIPGCSAIHMFFMRFPIDVVFADKEKKVVGLVRNIKPFFLSPIFFRAYFAIELQAGIITAYGIQIGDVLSFE